MNANSHEKTRATISLGKSLICWIAKSIEKTEQPIMFANSIKSILLPSLSIEELHILQTFITDEFCFRANDSIENKETNNEE
jgi:hypothetical protein